MLIYINKALEHNCVFLSHIGIENSAILKFNNGKYEYAIIDLNDIFFKHEYAKFQICNCQKDDIHKFNLVYSILNDTDEYSNLEWNELDLQYNKFIDSLNIFEK